MFAFDPVGYISVFEMKLTFFLVTVLKLEIMKS